MPETNDTPDAPHSDLAARPEDPNVTTARGAIDGIDRILESNGTVPRATADAIRAHTAALRDLLP